MRTGQDIHIIFIPLAMNQTLFYVGVAKELLKLNYKVSFLPIHERSHQMLEEQGFQSFNFFEYGDSSGDLTQLCYKYDIKFPNLLTSHEREAYWINEDKLLSEKLVFALTSFEKILGALNSKGQEKVTIVQELGGFISVQSSLVISKRLNIPNYFIEPSFFRGRFFLNKNSIQARKIEFDQTLLVEEEVKKYLYDTLRERKLVIPTKDQAHYGSALKKLFNIRNLKRLYQKIYDKFYLGLREEFEYIKVHIKKHFFSLVNSVFLKRKYVSLKNFAPGFYYFPLHVPADVALTIRSPNNLNQLNLIEYIYKMLPGEARLLIKEHPAMRGAISSAEIKKLLKRFKRIQILNPRENNFDVMKQAEAVFTINSKAGAEAVLLGKKVVCFGEAFYTNHPHFAYLKGEFLNGNLSNADISHFNVENFFQNIWNESLRGDLYSLDSNNLTIFARSLGAAIEANN